jgi:NADPH2:quinone reductase
LPRSPPIGSGWQQTGRLAAGDRVLVHAGAGAIGHVAVQLARLLGASSIAATAGADVVADSAGDWADHLGTATPDGFDVIVDGFGGTTIDQDPHLLAPFGTLVWFGAAGGPPAAVSPTALTGMRYVAGSSFASWRIHHPGQVVANLHRLIRWAATGQLRTTVRAVVDLAEAAQAHTLIEDRAGVGRVVIAP